MDKNIYESFIPRHKEAALDFMEYIKMNLNTDNCLEDVHFHLLKFSVEGKYKLRNQCHLT